MFSSKPSCSSDKLRLDQRRNDIRVLALLPYRREDSIIRCDLLVINLDDSASWPFEVYLALSYTWGSPNATEKIILDGRSFKIGTNLASALRQLRVKGCGAEDTRYLWVDALCINQDDVVERSSQVRKMKMIYERAEQVLAWIGPAANGSEEAIDLLDLITDADTPGDYIAGYLQSEDPEKVRGGCALAMLLDRAYWARVWIRQELAVAKEIVVMCGDRMLSWDTFSRACDMVPDFLIEAIAAESSVHSNKQRDIADITSHRERVESDGHVSFEALLLHAKSCEATDPRDRVYGILNLAPKAVTELLKPDYTLVKAEVYEKATITAIETTRSLGLLSACEDPEQTSRLPTWVPDFETDWKLDSFKRRDEPLLGMRLYNADGYKQLQYELSPCRTKLHLKGIKFDQIANLGGFWNMEEGGFNEIVKIWQDFAIAAMGPDLPVWEAFEAFWRTLAADQEAEDNRMNFISTFALSVAAHIRDDGGDGRPRLDMQALEGFTGETSPYLDRVIATMAERQVFATSAGRIGTGSAELRKGDVICVLFGASMPFALRPHRDGTFAIVNEIYVHGVMDGEIVASDVPVEEIVLR